jgi:hypothetical protein
MVARGNGIYEVVQMHADSVETVQRYFDSQNRFYGTVMPQSVAFRSDDAYLRLGPAVRTARNHCEACPSPGPDSEKVPRPETIEDLLGPDIQRDGLGLSPARLSRAGRPARISAHPGDSQTATRRIRAGHRSQSEADWPYVQNARWRARIVPNKSPNE